MHFPNRHSRRGFTLTEVIIVIAVLAILLGLGIPGLLSLRQTIQIAKYDDLAREIYVAAQNNLSRLAANGMVPETAEVLSNTAAMASQPPQDYSEEFAWDAESYHYTQNGSYAMEALLPLGSIDDALRSNGHYVVEYNTKTNIVYGVFYAEKEFDYDTVASATDFRLARKVRKGFMVGYYGGSAVRRDEQNYVEKPQLELINENILQLNILNAGTNSGRTIEISITDGVKTVSADTLLEWDRVTGKCALLLDSLDSGKHFHELFPDLIPGADLSITVTFREEGKLPSSASISGNSLFAARDPGTGDEGDTARIAWARHLQNLEGTVSGLNDGNVKHALQTANIQWPEGYSFVSINNPHLKDYNGSLLEIRELKGENGLFAQANDMMLSGIRLVNPVIQGNGDGHIGALAGTAQNTQMISCGVYCDRLKDDGTVDYDAYPAYGITAGTAVAGGLAGSAKECIIRNSFAALPNISAQQGGSLVGTAGDCTVENSYAVCDNLPESQDFYYFLGGTGNKVNHCYAVGNVLREEKGKAFLPGTQATDCYFAVSHRDFAVGKDISATEFVTYDPAGAETQRKLEEMQTWGGTGWAAMIAPLTHPYREYLDGRAYPYPAITELDHYGSWPTSDGTVELRIFMRLLNHEDIYAIHAGSVVVTNLDEQDSSGNPVVLFDSKEHLDASGNFDGNNTVRVLPGTHIAIIVTDSNGYKYVSTQVVEDLYMRGTGDSSPYHPVSGYEIKKDTDITVTYQQSSFILTCEKSTAMDEYGNKAEISSGYSVDIPNRTLSCTNTTTVEAEVETGSIITVRLSVPATYSSTGTLVWYTLDRDPGTPHTVLPDENGYYVFTMPGEGTTLHVQYSKAKANYTIEFYQFPANGTAYPETPTKTINAEYGIGTVLNESLISALAKSSNLLLTIEDQEVLYLERAHILRDSNGAMVFEGKRDENGNMTVSKGPYTTVTSDKNANFTVKIYIARKQYQITLVSGENIQKVSFSGYPAEEQSVTHSFYYGQTIVANADVVPGQNFTAWEPDDSRFRANSSAQFTFDVPHYNLTLTARARQGYYLVSLSLLENRESWLNSSASRQADPVHITLVNSRDGSEIEMENRTDDTISYLVQAVVPSIPVLDEGYYIKVRYDSGLEEFYCKDGTYSSAEESQLPQNRVMLTVRDRAVESDLNFYTVTYYPTAMYYLGSVPAGGTYLHGHFLTVQGNTGLLRIDGERDSTNNNGKIIFGGWKDVYAMDPNAIYNGGVTFQVLRRTDFFADWNASLQVIYHENGGDGGELPVDRQPYRPGVDVTVKFSETLSRRGYVFLGWSEKKDGSGPIYTPQANTLTIGNTDVTLYAVWGAQNYTVTYWDGDNQLETQTTTFEKPLKALDYSKQYFRGWALKPGGDIVYRAGESFAVSEDLNLYARIVDQNITITYHYGENNASTKPPVTVGWGVPGYLYVQGQEVTGWNTQADLKGTFYPCDDSGKSEKSVAFTENTDLYAVYGKVYNYQQQVWYNTLYEAVYGNAVGYPVGKDNFGAPVYETAAKDGETLIVYRDTLEAFRIEFVGKHLYILAHGDRRIQWSKDARPSPVSGQNQLLSASADLYAACMYAQNGGVTLGRSDISNVTMEGSTLIFDANKVSRVFALDADSELNMYDGITFTNGYRYDNRYLENNARDNPNQLPYNGGGVYANSGGVFRMYGGTISYCTAISGGGVYLSPGGKMQMGQMVTPDYYSATAIYYEVDATGEYVSTNKKVTQENYKDFFVTSGDPAICYNESKHNKGTVTTGDGGGGILMLDLADGDLTLYRGSIHNNRTSANGGGIVTDCGPHQSQAANSAKLRIYEVDISHNRAEGYGGGVFQWQGILYIYNSTIRQNYAKLDGGGIYVHHYGGEASNIEFYYGDIANNEAGGNGGGAFVEAGLNMKIFNGNVYNNMAAQNGGGVYLQKLGTNNGFSVGPAVLELGGGSIYDNMAPFTNTQKQDNDVYLDDASGVWEQNRTVLTVPKDKGGLRITRNHPGQKKNYIVVKCGYSYSGRPVVVYQDTNDFRPGDTDHFMYGGTGDYTISPTEQKVDTGVTLTAPLILNSNRSADRTVTFDSNCPGVTAPDPVTGQVGQRIPLSIELERTGYYLRGWALSPDAYEEDFLAFYETSNGGQWFTKYENGSWTTPMEVPEYLISEQYTQTLYAMWRPYVVNYNLHTTYLDVSVASESVGPTVQILAPSKNSFEYGGVTYTFQGWSTDKNATEPDPTYDSGNTVNLTQNIILYAVWRPNIVKVTYDFNGGSNVAHETAETVTVLRGTNLKVLSAEDLGITRVGCVLTGWSTKPDGTGETYLPGAEIPIKDDTTNFTLYAVWTAASETKDVPGFRTASLSGCFPAGVRFRMNQGKARMQSHFRRLPFLL